MLKKKHYRISHFDCLGPVSSVFNNHDIFILEPPEVVIYDNACNLHQYCLNRDPNFFCNTRFYVDGLHWDGHVCKYSLF